ncbi:MAG: hypothetical protein H0A76_07240 [Candidatus Thiodubiliella endoseptemdiera]|uniref:Uncharacterized protein n=1 Tax=Candidatus Thiodubiliella endoseptemdiera TaxID=2738886 RepID=A0A853F2F1_9GAMM|nr:hypothetical protein [Candidatus Thiodubiliella endoseptemdiera]
MKHTEDELYDNSKKVKSIEMIDKKGLDLINSIDKTGLKAILNDGIDALAAVSTVYTAAKAIKEFLDGAYLTVSAENSYADVVMLQAFVTDDSKHNARSLPHKNFLFRGEADTGVFRVNSMSESNSTFLYSVETKNKVSTVLIQYKWSQQDSGSGKVVITDCKGKAVAIEFNLYKRIALESADKEFKVSLLATGGVMQLGIIKPNT